MKKICLFTVFCLAALLLCLSALADEPAKNTLYISLTPMEDGGPMPADAVMWQRTGGKYYFFLPGNADLSQARIWFAGSGTVSVGGTKLLSGAKTDALKNGAALKIQYAGKNYVVNVMQGSQLPALFIATDSGSMARIDKSKKNKEAGALKLVNAQGETEYDGRLESIKLRGHTSATFGKKGYNIKLETKTGLLGMGKAKKWALISNARDHALLRNQIVFAMASFAGMAYTPGCVQVEVYLNHAYNGTYTLQEKIEIGKERIDIADLEKATEKVNDQPLDSYPQRGPDKAENGKFKYIAVPNDPQDITGGYVIEYENWKARYTEELAAYTTNKGKLIMVKEPEHASQAQMAYISAFMQGYENAIFAADGVDPDTGKRYDEFVDFDSLVLKFLLEEVSKNCDGNQSSQYYYKPADTQSPVAFAGPAWDYDTTFGDFGRAKDVKTLLSPTGLYQTTISGTKFWWPQLYAKPEFKTAVCRQWKEKFAPAMRILLGEEEDEGGKLLSMRQYAAAIADSAKMNFTLWPIKQGSENVAKCGKTFEANLNYLEDFIRLRYEFLTKEWEK